MTTQVLLLHAFLRLCVHALAVRAAVADGRGRHTAVTRLRRAAFIPMCCLPPSPPPPLRSAVIFSQAAHSWTQRHACGRGRSAGGACDESGGRDVCIKNGSMRTSPSAVSGAIKTSNTRAVWNGWLSRTSARMSYVIARNRRRQLLWLCASLRGVSSAPSATLSVVVMPLQDKQVNHGAGLAALHGSGPGGWDDRCKMVLLQYVAKSKSLEVEDVRSQVVKLMGVVDRCAPTAFLRSFTPSPLTPPPPGTHRAQYVTTMTAPLAATRAACTKTR